MRTAIAPRRVISLMTPLIWLAPLARVSSITSTRSCKRATASASLRRFSSNQARRFSNCSGFIEVSQGTGSLLFFTIARPSSDHKVGQPRGCQDNPREKQLREYAEQYAQPDTE